MGEQSPTPIGCLVNWGRSAIEGRNPLTVLQHVRLANEAGVLRGMMFSGCSDHGDSRGGAWADVHIPPASLLPDAKHSLLDGAAIANTLAEAGDPGGLIVMGMKVSAPPAASHSRRVDIVHDAGVTILSAARAAREHHSAQGASSRVC